MKKKAAARHNENAPEPVRPKRNITLRTATPRDCSPLYDVLIRYFEELKLVYPPPVEAPTMAWGLSIIARGGVVVAVEDDEIIGSVGVEVGQFPWNPATTYLNGVWFYVVPERRAGGTANKLMEAAKNLARKNKMGLRLDNVWGMAPERQDRYREMNGFIYVGGNHVWFPEAAGD